MLQAKETATCALKVQVPLPASPETFQRPIIRRHTPSQALVGDVPTDGLKGDATPLGRTLRLMKNSTDHDIGIPPPDNEALHARWLLTTWFDDLGTHRPSDFLAAMATPADFPPASVWHAGAQTDRQPFL